MALSSHAAIWFLPFVLPICFYVAFTDMREMRITNQAVTVLVVIYTLVGLIALPPWGAGWPTARIAGMDVTLPAYAWGFVRLVVVLIAGIVLNAAGVMGAGDAKFAAAAAPFVAIGDLWLLMMIFSANLLAAFVTHRLAKHSALRRLAPEWQSWSRGWDFPMGLALGGTLALYLALASVYGT